MADLFAHHPQGAPRITAEYTGVPVRIVATHSEHPGAAITTDAPALFGGSGKEVCPLDLLVVSLTCCLETIFASFLRSANVNLPAGSLRITSSSQMTPDGVVPKRIAKIALTVSVGVELSEEQKEMVVGSAALCPVEKSLHESIEVSALFAWHDGATKMVRLH
eukprot:m51a1_g8412 putative OsmC-like protein (163) ;mRNA; f:281560-282117